MENEYAYARIIVTVRITGAPVDLDGIEATQHLRLYMNGCTVHAARLPAAAMQMEEEHPEELLIDTVTLQPENPDGAAPAAEPVCRMYRVEHVIRRGKDDPRLLEMMGLNLIDSPGVSHYRKVNPVLVQVGVRGAFG